MGCTNFKEVDEDNKKNRPNQNKENDMCPQYENNKNQNILSISHHQNNEINNNEISNNNHNSQNNLLSIKILKKKNNEKDNNNPDINSENKNKININPKIQPINNQLEKKDPLININKDKIVHNDYIPESPYTKYDINNNYYLVCPDCKKIFPYIEKIYYSEDINDFVVLFFCVCKSKSESSPLDCFIETKEVFNICPIHISQKIIYFCKNCKKLFCQLCQKEHVNHEIENYNNCFPKHIKDFLIKNINEKKDKVKGIEILSKIIEKYLNNMDNFVPINDQNEDSDISFNERANENEIGYYCEKTLKGHKDKVVSITLLQSGCVATGSYDSTIRIWTLDNYNCTKILQDIGSVIYLLEIEPNKILSATSECNIGLWDIDNNDCKDAIFNFLGHELWVNSLVKCNDRFFASGSNDKNIFIWDYHERKQIRTIKAHDDCILCLIKLKNGNLCSGSSDLFIKIWNWNNGYCLSKIKAHENWVKCLCEFEDGIIISGSDDKTIKIWKNDQCLNTLNGHTNSVRTLCKIDENYFASGSFDNTIKIWDFNRKACIQDLRGHTSNVSCLLKLNNDDLISCSTDYTIKIWKKDKKI